MQPNGLLAVLWLLMAAILRGDNMHASIKGIEYYLPENILTNEQLALDFPEWPATKIEQKLGIVKRYLCQENECASDLGFAAAKKLFASGICEPQDIDFVLFCTQSPDYFLPTTACLLQDRLNIPTTAGALDFNLGCSGFVYGLSLAKGLIVSEQARNVLLITAETYSKHLAPSDKATRTLFSDGAAATLVQASEKPGIGPMIFGTDGKGAANLIVSGGSMRNRAATNLYMNGPEIFTFTLKAVPEAIEQLLKKANKNLSDIDWFIFHQASKYMLEKLRDKIGISKEKFIWAMRDYGNTVSSTIPIAYKEAQSSGVLQQGQQVMLVGFGVGYSWGACLIDNTLRQ